MSLLFKKEIPELSRMENAILIVLYEKHPIGMSEEEIMDIIAERNLLNMTDEEFKSYKQDIIKAKRN
jgi:hypothetical protein